MLDLLIGGGLIVDGTGNPGFYGAVGIVGETLRILRGDRTDAASFAAQGLGIPDRGLFRDGMKARACGALENHLGWLDVTRAVLPSAPTSPQVVE